LINLGQRDEPPDVSPDPHYIFAVGNAIEGAGSSKSDLLAILPGPYRSACEELSKNTHNIAIARAEHINIAPVGSGNVEKVITLTVPKPLGCVETVNGLYYYQLLIER
jgi:hypothetical protein